ncbi:MAG: serine/threonine protein kinase [Myxococcales bacterium]|nr:serine/threonine protein kinase [Myxococcales bacterium]
MDARHDPPPRLGGRYELLDVVGRGGMASVWRAHHHGVAGFRRPVAIKQLLPSLAANDHVAAMFVEEARVVSELSHPHVVQVHDFGRDDDGQYFIAMELVEGTDLGSWIVRHVKVGKPTPWRQVVAIVQDALRGLAAAHERRDEKGVRAPVFHRDLTPSNVLISRHGQAKLADFGLARAMDRVTMTSPGVVKGKIAYVAPEMIAGARASEGSDLYSLGVVLWEALAGRRLYEGVSDLELFVRVGRGEVPPLREVRTDLPEGLCAAADRLLAKHPDERFRSAAAAREALRDVLRADARDGGGPLEPEDVAAYLATLS